MAEHDNSKLILNVDDNDINRYAITRVLRNAGFEVLEAATGYEALVLVKQSPDIVLLDVKLPDISGFEVCQKIKENPATASIPVLHLSATYTSGDYVVRGLDFGADAYLTRPVESTVLIATIRALLRTRRAEEDAKRARDEAIQASRARDQFMAVLSHELRTPLTPVLGILSMLEEDPQTPSRIVPDLQMARRNVELEARLIDDLLDLTRIAKGRINLNMESLDVHALLESVKRICCPDSDAKNLSIQFDLQAKDHWIMADSARLHQVFWNILKNAVKFSPADSQVVCKSYNTADGQLIVTITDYGIGIAPEMIDRIFDAFEQGGEDMAKRFGGLGLGLSISKVLITAQGGSIRAKSTGKGQGATFEVTMPVAAPDESRRQSHPIRSLAAPGAGLNILLVEDHADTLAVMKRLLERNGHKITPAENIKTALALVQASTFDLLISDIGLPDGTGIDLLRHVLAIRPMPAIALSGYGMEADVLHSREAGFTAHLTKPVNLSELQRALQQIMELKATC